MADFTKTVSNRVEMFGMAPANYFNEYNWNEFYWGYKNHNVVTNTRKVLSNSISFAEDSASIYLRNRAGYYYNFVDRVTNAHSRSNADWTQVTDSSTAWTEVTPSSAATWVLVEVSPTV